ncbi:glycoside hydrolase family 3 protein [Maribacter chungangensis]|uniref:beta-N-acetylhexosaminidase n=1 Tax=Maribacter chungangensis TaxID=1069117 RepID=A0ABW3B6C9_9FLAO
MIDLESVKKTLTIHQKIGQLFMPAAFINDTEDEILRLEKLIKTHNIGSLCFFHSRASAATNYEGKKKVVYNKNSFETLRKLIERYQSVSKIPLLIAIDAEWGLAMRIENTPQYPYAITLGAIQNANDLLFEVGANIAKDCKAAGIHWNLAPVVDINNNPDNPVIGYRSFGEDREQVSQKAIALIKGMESENILTSIKHFPGHGDTDTDSHLGLPVIGKSKEELVENELYPFQQIINKGVDSVMAGHLSVPGLTTKDSRPSSINKDIITDLLRNEMGFTGVVISDALNMHAVSKNYPEKGMLEWLAFDAGNDVLCFTEHTAEGIESIFNNATEEQIDDSFQRIWELKEKAFRNSNSNTNVNSITHLELDFLSCSHLNRKLAEKSLTLLQGDKKGIATFRDTDYCTLTIKRFSEGQDSHEILNGLETSKKEVANETHILLLLTPPNVKPTNHFGFLDQELDFINQLIATKKVVLYHFGNPLALRNIYTKDTVATVIAYQDFKEFQDVATEHFLGKLEAKGKIPVTL